MSGGKEFDAPKGDDTFAPGEIGGVIKNYTPEEAQRAMMETAAYENETEDQDIEGAELDDDEIASIKAELEEDDGEAEAD